MARAKTPRDGNGGVRKAPVTTMQLEGKQNLLPMDLETEIRRRAYELYEQRGCTPGQEHEDWLVAEQEVLTRYNQQQSA